MIKIRWQKSKPKRSLSLMEVDFSLIKTLRICAGQGWQLKTHLSSPQQALTLRVRGCAKSQTSGWRRARGSRERHSSCLTSRRASWCSRKTGCISVQFHWPRSSQIFLLDFVGRLRNTIFSLDSQIYRKQLYFHGRKGTNIMEKRWFLPREQTCTTRDGIHFCIDVTGVLRPCIICSALCVERANKLGKH